MCYPYYHLDVLFPFCSFLSCIFFPVCASYVARICVAFNYPPSSWHYSCNCSIASNLLFFFTQFFCTFSLPCLRLLRSYCVSVPNTFGLCLFFPFISFLSWSDRGGRGECLAVSALLYLMFDGEQSSVVDVCLFVVVCVVILSLLHHARCTVRS